MTEHAYSTRSRILRLYRDKPDTAMTQEELAALLCVSVATVHTVLCGLKRDRRIERRIVFVSPTPADKTSPAV